MNSYTWHVLSYPESVRAAFISLEISQMGHPDAYTKLSRTLAEVCMELIKEAKK